MTTHEGEDSSDGWTVDDDSHSKAKEPNSTWTKQDHQVRFRISGSYRDGIGTPGDSYAFESCVELRRGELTNCIAAIAVPEPAHPENPPENVSRSSLMLSTDDFPGFTGWWQWMHEYIAFPVTMHPLPTGNDYVTMSFSTRDNTAIDGQDYWGGSGSVRFDANSGHTQIVNIRIIDDRAEDSGDYFHFYIYQCEDRNNESCDHLFVDSSVKGIIYNTEESAEIAKLKVSDVTVTEGDGATADFTVSLTAPTTAAVHFDYATEDGTAKDGADYTGGSGSAFLANGDTSVTISVPISNDETWTGDRSFTLKISDAVYAAISDDSGKATIRDDEPQPLVARFTNIPSGNHGDASFEFNISFNQDVATQYLVMQNDAMTVTNGAITRAERISGSRDLWCITVQPDSGADVTVHLPATEDCADTGAVCTRGNQPQALSNSVTQTFVGTALNVRFASNANHNGKDAFTAELIFSEQTDTTAAELKDHALTTQGGSITSVAAKTEGSTRAWTVTLQPSGLDHLTITLTGATDCATDGHVCTAGGKLLSHTLIKKVYGPVQLSISDAATTEGEGATLTFTVTAENDTVDKYTVSYTTSDGTATAGEDYTATSGVLAYTYGAGPLTVSVPVLSDDETESAETVTLTLSNPSQYVHIKDGQATGTIEDGVQEEETQANSAPTGLPSIPGTPKAGEPLTADTSAINDADGLTGVTYSYQWVRTAGGEDEDIGTATGASYTPDNNDVDQTLKVRVSFEDDVGNDESLTSLPTAAVARSADGTVWSADMLVVEYTEISIGAATADRFSNIGGSGNLQIKSLWSYVPDKDLRLAFTDTFADAEDHTLIVGDLTLEFPAGSSGEQSFKWTNVDLNWEDGRTIAVSIVPTTPAEPVANTPATGLPTITGTSAQVGKALTVDTSGIADQDGLTEVSYSYRWIGNDGNVATNLQHSTVRTYTPSASDVGMTIKVNVSFTDDADNNESLTSIATAAVLATVPTAPSSLTVTAGSQIQELDASWQAPTSNGGSDVTGYKLQWKETADSWDNPADVSEATVTGTTHTITGLTGGVEYAVRVIATNTIGNSPASTEVAGTPGRNRVGTDQRTREQCAHRPAHHQRDAPGRTDAYGRHLSHWRPGWTRQRGLPVPVDCRRLEHQRSHRLQLPAHRQRAGADDPSEGDLCRRRSQPGVPDQRRDAGSGSQAEYGRYRRAHHQRDAQSGRDADRRHLSNIGRGRPRQRLLPVPVAAGRCRYSRADELYIPAGLRRRGQDHQGKGDLQRRRRQRRVPDQRGHNGRGRAAHAGSTPYGELRQRASGPRRRQLHLRPDLQRERERGIRTDPGPRLHGHRRHHRQRQPEDPGQQPGLDRRGEPHRKRHGQHHPARNHRLQRHRSNLHR